ncbi:MAG: O-methyltransferase family protein [Epsilonproteobacteria bacterium]|nr:O-methyltransferase family protein [Campylobacterota bacterium]
MTTSTFSLLTMIMLNRAVYVAADLGIADHLATQPMTVSELACVTHTKPESLQRMLYLLELHGVFKQQEDMHYCLTDFSESMRQTTPNSIRPFLLHDDDTRWNSFGHLGYSVTTGNAAFDMLYGQSYFQHLQQNPQLSARFNDAMMTISCQEDSAIATKLVFEKVVADIGGGKGQLLNKIITNHAITQAILFDLPEVIDQANSVDSICLKIGGSFFDPLPFSADIFVLKRILHDWNNEKALTILKNIRHGMHADSRLYIIEGILDYSEDKKLLAAIDLALLTIFQGQERTKSEFDVLITAAGLEVVSIKNLDSVICAIECKRSESH